MSKPDHIDDASWAAEMELAREHAEDDLRYFDIETYTREDLAFAVAVAMGWKISMWGTVAVWVDPNNENRYRCHVADFNPAERWDQGGPILERFDVMVGPCTEGGTGWGATIGHGDIRVWTSGPTMLLAGIRCVVTHHRLHRGLPIGL